MKTLLHSMAVISLLGLCSCSQMITFTEQEHVTVVYDDLAGTKDQLYLRANDWMVSVFNDASSVIQFSDKEEGVVIGKYLIFGGINTGLGTSYDYRVFSVIDIRVKDNKARIEIKPQGPWKYNEMTVDNYSKEQAIEDMKKLAESFHTAMIKKGVEF